MAKLDMNKMAGSDRLKANTGVLPAFGAKEKAATTDTTKEKRVEEEAKKPAPEQKAKNVSVTPAAAVQKTEEVKKQESVPALTPVKEAGVVSESAGRRPGRPRNKPLEFNEDGQRVINTNVPLEEELQLFLEYCLTQDPTVTSKGAFIHKLVKSCYEKNFTNFHAWKKGQKKGIEI